MEIQTRRPRSAQIQDQENIYAVKGKSNLVVPNKRQGLGVRGALGEVNGNVQLQRDVAVGKVNLAAAEIDKKCSNKSSNVKSFSNYSHVQSKVDTGRSLKATIQPSCRPALRREESTAALATRAAVRNNGVLKDVQYAKTTINIKKDVTKKSSKLHSVKEDSSLKSDLSEDSKIKRQVLKANLKESESLTLKKLTLTEKTSLVQKVEEINVKYVQNTVVDDEVTLPDDIEDIDAGDTNSPLLMSTYIKEIYQYLIELEEKYPIQDDHLKNQIVITGKMRATLMDWLVEVQRQFSLLLETFQLTVGIIDRYLQAVPNIQRSQLQLVGITAMFIASKYEEIYAPEVGDFVYVTDNAYSKADVFQCERDIMSKLGYCLARPIPLSFLRRFIKAAHGTSKNHHLSKYLVDLSLVEYSMAHYRPSELAAAAICLSLYVLSSKSLDKIWTPTMAFYSGYSFEHVKPILKKIAAIVINADKGKFKAVYNKYSDPSLAKVSCLPQLRGETIQSLAAEIEEE